MFGLIPTNPYHLFALLIPLAIWLLGRKLAKKRHLAIMHTASFTVSYWEEILFRGVIWGSIFGVTGNVWIALISSSLLFGVFHLRNSWWASKKRLVGMCMYSGLAFGPLIGLVLMYTGDIYIGIALHALHNFVAMYYPDSSRQPKDEYLRSRMQRRNGFQKLFSWQ